MHLYENAERSVYAWNAVDVEINGRVQHGHVVGVEKKGSRVIVDFGCPTQEAVAMECGKAIDCSRCEYQDSRRGDEVEVLLHDGPGRPWTWYPGRMLIPEFRPLYSVQLVEVLVAGQWRRELLPGDQIRDPPLRNCLMPWDFVTETCSVPSGFWTLERSASALLLRKIEHELRVRFIKVLSWKMRYVRREVGHVSDEDVAAVFERERRNLAFCHEVSEKTDASDGEPKRKKSSRVVESGLALLPLEVLKEVFHSLDTVDRQRCRRTCPLWETLLTSVELCRDLRVMRQTPYRLPHPVQLHQDCNYTMYCCLFKHITRATRTICIADTDKYILNSCTMNVAGEAVDVIKKALNDTGIRIHRLILHRRSMQFSSESCNKCPRWKLSRMSRDMTKNISKLASCCDRLILKDFGLTLVNKAGEAVMGFGIPAAAVVLESVNEAQIVDLLEEHLECDAQPLDMERIAHCMASLAGSQKKARIVKKVFRDYQSCDPRPSAHYRNHTWTADSVAEVDMRRLNKFCLHALARFMHNLSGASTPDDHAEVGPSSDSESSESESGDAQSIASKSSSELSDSSSESNDFSDSERKYSDSSSESVSGSNESSSAESDSAQ
ncbi:uncharacterized protein LOC129597743 [Paramacrobiotus metropolitanus]|uniref:uncharacterized protein LOC129597743 n=1 Tax=Paramacrobiotus metropolitanus TaxID=2943436 RepID=UPI002445F1CD|nr:uncharacterized protein LOC129597743 [Paramacrobiotus metropolitanus]